MSSNTPNGGASAKTIPSLASYSLLGRSGLRVSPLCLGTMTFGNESFGHGEAEARPIYSRFREAGGNFIDTADLYAGGKSEQILGRIMKEDGDRDRVVLATKFNFNSNPTDPNGGGNSRKHILEAVEASLKRLQTDYIDLYWMHAWDTLTPPEEVLMTLNLLIQQGKIRYYGFSDTPAWYVGYVMGLAQARGLAAPIALQLEYNLLTREIEDEFVPLAQQLGLGITPWSPLASGMLSGKYRRDSQDNQGRLSKMKDSKNPVFHKLTGENFAFVETLVKVAEEVGRKPAEVALNWVAKRPGVTSTIIGASKLEQLESNIRALEFDLPDSALKTLDEASQRKTLTPYMFFGPGMLKMALGERPVTPEPAWFR